MQEALCFSAFLSLQPAEEPGMRSKRRACFRIDGKERSPNEPQWETGSESDPHGRFLHFNSCRSVKKAPRCVCYLLVSSLPSGDEAFKGHI